MTDALSAAQVAIYAVLIIPVLFLVVRHGVQGLLGWLFLALFCTLRLIGGGMAVNSSSPTATIISSVGLSPILLAAAGILHEARIFRIQNINHKVEWAFALFYHIPVVVGVALTAAGSSKLQHHEDPEKSLKTVKAGMAILVVSWAILVGWTGFTFTAPRAMNAKRDRVGTVLLWSSVFALVFLGVRVFYSLVTLSTQKPYLNPTTGTMPIRVILGFLPDLIAGIIYVTGGLMTQGATKMTNHAGDDVSLRHK